VQHTVVMIDQSVVLVVCKLFYTQYKFTCFYIVAYSA